MTDYLAMESGVFRAALSIACPSTCSRCGADERASERGCVPFPRLGRAHTSAECAHTSGCRLGLLGSEWSISIFPSVPCSQMQTRNHQNCLHPISSVCSARLIFLRRTYSTSCMKHEFLSDFRSHESLMESLAYAKEWYTSTVIHGNSRSVDGCARSIQLPLTQSIFLASRLSTGDLAVKSNTVE